MTKAPDPEVPATRDDEPGATERKEGNHYLVSGVAIGAAGVASAALLGATCPLCVVAAPGFVGYGLYKRWRAGRMAEPEDGATEENVEPAAEPSGPR